MVSKQTLAYAWGGKLEANYIFSCLSAYNETFGRIAKVHFPPLGHPFEIRCGIC